jgi:peptide/nickel transport system substrate-binding protein
MRCKTRWHAAAFGLVALFAVQNATGAVAQTSGPKANPNGSLVVAEDVPPQTFDPTQSSQIRTWYMWQLVYEGLVLTDMEGKIGPVLAKRWTVSADKLQYDFDLRDGVTFSDGSPLTADDVVFSFERLTSGGLPYAKDRFKHLKAVTKVDDHKVKFVLSQPDAGFLLNLGSPFLVGSAILSKKWAESHNPKLEMLGTGPFKMISYAPNAELTLARNDSYWNKDGIAKVAKLTIRYMPEQSAQVAGMKAGQIDLIFPSAETNLQLKRDPSIKTIAVTSTNTVRLNINTKKAPFDNVDVRRALSLAINRDEVVKGAFLGEATVSAQVPPSYSWALKPADLKYQKYDPEQARALLVKAGYPNGLDVTLNHLAGYATYLDRFSEVLKSQLAKVGIRVAIEANQNAVWLDKQNKANYEIMDNEYAFQADPLFYLMPRPGRQGPTPPEMEVLIAAASASDSESYTPKLQALEKMQDDLAFPDITMAARNGWVSYTGKVLSANPDSTLSRSFLAGVSVK